MADENTDSVPARSRNALVSHPHFGSLWLVNATVENGYVVGEVAGDMINGHLTTDVMNFPVSCVRKWEPPC